MDGYAALDLALAVLRLGLSLWALCLIVHSLRVGRGGAAPSEMGTYRVLTLGFVLLGLNVVALPLLYLVLQRMVTAYPETMCIYGVTRIGAGSAGAVGWLPLLLQWTQWATALSILLCGAWLLVHLLDRQSRDGSLRRVVLTLAGVAALVTLTGSSAEAAYLAIPRTAATAPAGCCVVTTALVPDSRTAGSELAPPERLLWAAHVGLTALMVAGLLLRARGSRRPRALWLAVGAGASAAVGGRFLQDALAPALLQLPYHRCVYDLVLRFPEMTLGLGLFAGALALAAWGSLLAGLRVDEALRSSRQVAVRKLFSAAAYAYMWSLVFVVVEVAAA